MKQEAKNIDDDIHRYQYIRRIPSQEARRQALITIALDAQHKQMLESVMDYFKSKFPGGIFNRDEFLSRYLSEEYYPPTRDPDPQNPVPLEGALDSRYSCGMFRRFFEVLKTVSGIPLDEDIFYEMWIEWTKSLGKRVVIPISTRSQLYALLRKFLSAKDIAHLFIVETSPDGFCFFNAYRDFLNLPNYGKTTRGIRSLRDDVLAALEDYPEGAFSVELEDGTSVDIADRGMRAKAVNMIINKGTRSIDAELVKILPYFPTPVNYILISTKHDNTFVRINLETYDPTIPTVIIYADGTHYSRIECDSKTVMSKLVESIFDKSETDIMTLQQMDQQQMQVQDQKNHQRNVDKLLQKAAQAQKQISAIQQAQRKRIQAQRAQRRLTYKQPRSTFHSFSLAMLQNPPAPARALPALAPAPALVTIKPQVQSLQVGHDEF